MRVFQFVPDPNFQQQNIVLAAPDDENPLLAYNGNAFNRWASPGFIQYSNKQPTKWNWSLNSYNNLAVFIHFINALIVFVLCFTYLDSKPENVVFVSGKIKLSSTNYALVDINTKETCDDVKHYSNDYKALQTNNMQNIHIFNDFMPHSLYDFSNKTLFKYDIPDYSLQLHYMIAFFFTLSFVFQAINGMYLGFEGSFPRVMSYFEYSISSSLMIVVLAVNTGILELYTIIAFFGLFFGMNILGACAEIISWTNAYLFQNRSMKFGWLIPHFAAWVLFLIVYIPILAMYEKVRSCSAGVPGFITAAIYVEFLFFILFGISQTYFLAWRSIDHAAKVEWYMDFVNITLSIVAKTFLAWVLIGPVLSVHEISDIYVNQ